MPFPLISVIMPAYNAGKCIRESLVSLCAQQFTAFEVLVVDGGSKDNTLAILEEFAAKDKRIRFISEPDKGIYDAMNKGVRLAAGEWLYFLGSDDKLYNDSVLATVAEVLQKTTANLVYGDVLMGNQKQRYDGPFTYEKLLSKNISHQAIFYQRKVFGLVGEYNISYKAHADWAYNIRCFNTAAVRVEYMNVLVAFFGTGGISSQHDVPFLREFLLPARLSYLEQTGGKLLKHISYYDEWWRLFRNAGIRSRKQFLSYSGAHTPPAVLLNMVSWQRLLPPGLLKNGLVSKCGMFLNYIFNRISGKTARIYI
jgi:glycosyltransferase involved in cell wall biosynthesis